MPLKQYMKHLAIYSLLFVSIFFFTGGISHTTGKISFIPVAQAVQRNPDDISNSSIISCYNNCGFDDVLRTINNLITFLITVLFVPIVVIMFMYAGFRYLMAQGDPKKLVDLKSLIKHIALGMILILSAWLIVKVILTVLVKDEDSALQFLQK